MRRILAYAKENGFTPYTSTLAEAWRASIVGLTDNLVASIKARPEPAEFTPHQDYTADPGTAFGVLEAERHRSRGIDLGMFMGLMKYYRQSYLDLVKESELDTQLSAKACDYIIRYFDSIELGFVTEWLSFSSEDLNKELQHSNRQMTLEKNKYLTIFESQPLPAILLDQDGLIENTNNASSEILSGLEVSGATYYGGKLRGERLPFFKDELAQLAQSDQTKLSFEAELEIKGVQRYFSVQINKMLDVSDKFTGYVVILMDLTEIKRAEALQIEAERRKVELLTIRAAAGTTAHEINNPLTGIIGVFEEFKDYQDQASVELAQMGLVAARRIKHSVEKMASIENPEYKPYMKDRVILDLENTGPSQDT